MSGGGAFLLLLASGTLTVTFSVLARTGYAATEKAVVIAVAGSVVFSVATRGAFLDFGGWHWFWYVKKPSIVAGVAVLHLVARDVFPRFRHQLAVAMQWALLVNIGEAAVLGSMTEDWATVIAMVLLMPCFPYLVFQGGRFSTIARRPILGFGPPLRVTERMYCRGHFITFVAFYMTNFDWVAGPTASGPPKQSFCMLYLALQNLLGYVGMEFVDRTCPMQWFVINRAYSLLMGSILDTFVHPQFFQQIDITLESSLAGYRKELLSSRATRNSVAVGIISILYIVAWTRDAVSETPKRQA